MIQIRLAEALEIDWINSCYDEVEFAHSIFEREVIAIAEFEGQKSGLGRLVTIDASNLELGGMYVFENFRGQGIARRIVEFLLKSSNVHQNIYCIPFEHLVPFYSEFGFVTCTHLEHVPQAISTKYSWCRSKYSNPTSLLVLRRDLSRN